MREGGTGRCGHGDPGTSPALGLEGKKIEYDCIVIRGDRVPEESEDPKGTRVRRVTR